MQARHVVAAVLLVVLALVAWKLSSTEDDKKVRAQYSDEEAPSGAAAAASPSIAASSTGALTTKTVRDAKLREEMRRRIAEAWSASAKTAGDPAPEAKQGHADMRYAPMPERADGKIDPDYLRQRVKEDFLPMAKGCYNELLARDPKAAGKVVVRMKIVGDEHVGGIVEDATIERDAGSLGDDKLETCFRESMMSMAFAPPPHGGSVTVVYPFTLAGSDPDAPKEGGP